MDVAGLLTVSKGKNVSEKMSFSFRTVVCQSRLTDISIQTPDIVILLGYVT